LQRAVGGGQVDALSSGLLASGRRAAVGTGQHDGKHEDRGGSGSLQPLDPSPIGGRGRFRRSPTIDASLDQALRGRAAETHLGKGERELLDPGALLDDGICLVEEIGRRRRVDPGDQDDFRRW
jgi:hypothetical protein